MRDIKFRAWDKERKQMRYQDKEFFYVGLRRGLNGNEFWKDLGSSIDNFFTPVQGELMQYTGLKDKNGKEIYEGDRLSGIWGECHIAWCDKCKSFEVFITATGECMSCEGDIMWLELVEDDGKLEVIGNIHEG